MVLRIEDLDRGRSKQSYIDALQRDFEALGLTWDAGPYFQHDRDDAYQAALDRLEDARLTYPCFCTRADIHAASAPHQGDKTVYAGTCRKLTLEQRQCRLDTLARDARMGHPARKPAIRLVTDGRRISVRDMFCGIYIQQLDTECGDFVIKRSDGLFAYQLAVVVDDAAQGITSVVRGHDLLASTPQQVYLQQLLDLPMPCYGHVPLLVTPQGARLAKRNKDASLEALVARLGSPQAVIGHIAHLTGLVSEYEPTTPEKLLGLYDEESLRLRWRDQPSIAFPPTNDR